MHRLLHAPARPALLALTLLITVACSASSAVAQSPTNEPAVTQPNGGGTQSNPVVVQPDPPKGPDQPVDGGPGGPAPIDPDSQWMTTQPRNDLQNLNPQSWDHISISPDGRTLTVYFWGGVAPCYGLASVNVSTANGVTTIGLVSGTPPAMGDMACIEIAVGYKVIVQLDQPFVVDGANIRDQ